MNTFRRSALGVPAALCAGAVVVLLAAAGCSCFPVGCPLDPLVIKILPSSGQFPPGENMVTAAFEGKLFECRFHWPPAPNTVCGSELVHFSVKDTPERSVEVSFIGAPRPPARVKLTYVAGAISAEKDLVPQYQEQEKRPDTCGPPCIVARETWMVP